MKDINILEFGQRVRAYRKLVRRQTIAKFALDLQGVNDYSLGLCELGVARRFNLNFIFSLATLAQKDNIPLEWLFLGQGEVKINLNIPIPASPPPGDELEIGKDSDNAMDGNNLSTRAAGGQ